uniref:Tetraspanin n=1 Tax=Nothobranchius pienaari TaxID=704102 RepID=A0A1A8PJU1_9TELE
MAQVNSCLKRIFIAFNLFFAIVGGVIIGLAMLSQVLTNVNQEQMMENRTSGLILLYVIGASTMLIALLGAYGASKENKVCLVVFLVFMVIGALLMIRIGVPAAFLRPQLEGELFGRFSKALPLNTASDEVKLLADSLQTQLHCCGLFSYRDWNDAIPDSCSCVPTEKDECQLVSYRSSMTFYSYLDEQNRKSVYTKTCFPVIMHYVFMGFDLVIGVVFTLAGLAVVGLILSSIMIHQLRRPARTTILFSIPTTFTPGLPKYQELQNPPPKYEELQNPPPY